MSWLAVAAGAVLGAWLRWGLALLFNAMHATIALGTLAANLGGGLLIGMAIGFFSKHPDVFPTARLFVITGFLGGLTTFSSFTAESLGLLQRGHVVWALGHSALHMFGSLACCFVGYALIRMILS